MMDYGLENKALLRYHHLIFESVFQAKKEWISIMELTLFFNALHPDPKNITFECR